MNMNKSIKFSLFVLTLTLVAVILSSVGTSELITILMLCLLFAIMVFGNFCETIKSERKNKEKIATMTLEDFFKMGGVAYYFNKGSEWKECKSFGDFQGVKADYLQFYLNGKRYIFEDQLSVGKESKN